MFSYIELHTQLKHAPICEMINIWWIVEIYRLDWKIPKMSSMSCSVLRNLFLSVVVFWSVTVQCKTIRRNMSIYDLYRDCCQIQFAFCSDKSNDAFSRIIYFNMSNLKVANVPYDYYIGFKYLNHIKFRWSVVVFEI